MYTITRDEIKKTYSPDEAERKFILNAYQDFLDDRQLKTQSYPILGNRTLQQFWDDSNHDYNSNTDLVDPLDPVVPYSSTISRDKANTLISQLTMELMYPSVTAQNANQEIDVTMSRVSRALLQYAHENDGRPAESGHRKLTRYVHKQVVEGTVHVQDDIVDSKLVSTLVPNEEIYISNYWEPNIQNQPHLFRVQDNITYEEAEREFNELPTWEYVQPGNYTNWLNEDVKFKQRSDGLIDKNRVQIVRIWKPLTRRELRQQIDSGNLPDHVKRAKWFNILINGVLMFSVDNLMPYHDGFYPVNKGIFEHFSKAEFYWGNSLPNKVREDKKWLDSWKTLIRYKGKLSTIPPLLTFNGQYIDSDVVVPGMITQVPVGMKPTDISAIPGLTTGVSNSDIALMRDAMGDIDRGSSSPQTAGIESAKRKTMRETVILEQNAQRALSAFGLEIAFLVEARTYPILMRLFQYLPRQAINKIAVPNQMLIGGKRGSFEIIFTNLPEMTADDYMQKSIEILKEERKFAEAGNYKQIQQINIEYLKNLDLYVKVVADVLPKKTGALRKAEAELKWSIYKADPDIFNKKAAARKLVQEMDDDENEMLLSEGEMKQGQEQGQQEGQVSPMTKRLTGDKNPVSTMGNMMQKTYEKNLI